MLDCYIINLDRAQDRWAATSEKFRSLGLNVIRVPAVAGKDLTFPHPDFAAWRFFLWHGRKAVPNEVGCFFSHIKALKTFLETGKDHALICEDDVFPLPQLVEVLHEAMRYSGSWDLLRLSGNRPTKGVNFATLSHGFQLRCDLKTASGTGASIVNRHAAETIIKKCLPMRAAYDDTLYCYWPMGIREVTIQPFPITLGTLAGNSTIEGVSSRCPYLLRFFRPPYRYFTRTTRKISRILHAMQNYFWPPLPVLMEGDLTIELENNDANQTTGHKRRAAQQPSNTFVRSTQGVFADRMEAKTQPLSKFYHFHPRNQRNLHNAVSPKISIIIPVYNVEKYLAKCLDSVLAQTFGDFEVLCVDHSSTDGSLAILQEYADKDERIKIIPCVNTSGGPGQARNAGLAHVQGKYTYFLDSDDWIDPTLCEKVYYRLESSGADVVFFFQHVIEEEKQKNRPREASKHDLRRWLVPSLREVCHFQFPIVPWNRVIRSDFLRKIDFRFPEEMIPEDYFCHWYLLLHEPKTEVVAEKLYFHLIRDGSQQGQLGEYVARSCQADALLKKYLQKVEKYELYREKFLVDKYKTFVALFPRLQKTYKTKVIQWLHETIDEDEIHFLKNEKSLDILTRKKILVLLRGNHVVWLTIDTISTINRVIRRFIIKPVETLIKLRKSTAEINLLFERRIDELNQLIAERDKEIVELKRCSLLSNLCDHQ